MTAFPHPKENAATPILAATTAASHRITPQNRRCIDAHASRAVTLCVTVSVIVQRAPRGGSTLGILLRPNMPICDHSR